MRSSQNHFLTEQHSANSILEPSSHTAQETSEPRSILQSPRNSPQHTAYSSTSPSSVTTLLSLDALNDPSEFSYGRVTPSLFSVILCDNDPNYIALSRSARSISSQCSCSHSSTTSTTHSHLRLYHNPMAFDNEIEFE